MFYFYVLPVYCSYTVIKIVQLIKVINNTSATIYCCWHLKNQKNIKLLCVKQSGKTIAGIHSLEAVDDSSFSRWTPYINAHYYPRFHQIIMSNTSAFTIHRCKIITHPHLRRYIKSLWLNQQVSSPPQAHKAKNFLSNCFIELLFDCY